MDITHRIILIAFIILFTFSCKKTPTSSENAAPVASFTINPTSGTVDTVFDSDAISSSDNEDELAVLQIRWDWENDNTYDTNYLTTKTATNQYSTPGTYTVKLEVRDSGGLTNTATNTVSVQQQSIVVTFPDANFETLIRETIGKPTGDIMNTDLTTIIELQGRQREITNISGIEHCTGLEILDLGHNTITDISMLNSLTGLKTLGLYGNSITDINSISNLINLEKLHLTTNNIVDISPVSELTNIWHLSASNNQIEDISSLSNLITLQELYLSYNALNDISSLSSLTNLTMLELGSTQITDVDLLSTLTNLRTLRIHNNVLANLNGLTNLINLGSLNIRSTQTTNINVLAGLVNLTTLYMSTNEIVDISPLLGLIYLNFVELNVNQVVDIETLVNNDGINDGDEIWLVNNPLSDISINTYIPQLESRGVTVHQ